MGDENKNIIIPSFVKLTLEVAELHEITAGPLFMGLL